MMTVPKRAAAACGRGDARVGCEPGQVRKEAALSSTGLVPSLPGRTPRRRRFAVRLRVGVSILRFQISNLSSPIRIAHRMTRLFIVANTAKLMVGEALEMLRKRLAGRVQIT